MRIGTLAALACSAALLVGAAVGTTANARTLESERESHFFKWFNLQPSCEPASAGPDRRWHCFRPSAPQFRPLVEVAVLAHSSGMIIERRIGIDRAFIEHPRNSPFARDIAKSFLQWGVPEPQPVEIDMLIRRIFNPAALAPPVDTSAAPYSLVATPDAVGGYHVFMGRSVQMTMHAGSDGLAMINYGGNLPDGVHASSVAAMTPPPAPGEPSWLLIAISHRRR